ncbi:hypothetical protein PSAC2689_40067 [Paraburkholderia sacchari]
MSREGRRGGNESIGVLNKLAFGGDCTKTGSFTEKREPSLIRPIAAWVQIGKSHLGCDFDNFVTFHPLPGWYFDGSRS